MNLRKIVREVTGKKIPGVLKLGERAFFVGHTGTGKTYLATSLIEKTVPPLLPVVVIDPKKLLEVNAGSEWEILDDLPRRWDRMIRHPKKPRQ